MNHTQLFGISQMEAVHVVRSRAEVWSSRQPRRTRSTSTCHGHDAAEESGEFLSAWTQSSQLQNEACPASEPWSGTWEHSGNTSQEQPEADFYFQRATVHGIYYYEKKMSVKSISRDHKISSSKRIQTTPLLFRLLQLGRLLSVLYNKETGAWVKQKPSEILNKLLARALPLTHFSSPNLRSTKITADSWVSRSAGGMDSINN